MPFPNEPSGSTLVTNYDISSIPPGNLSTSVGGWRGLYGGSRIQLISDGSAPQSPPAVAQYDFDGLSANGISPGSLVYENGSFGPEIYYSFFWKPSNPFKQHLANSTKVAFLWNGGSSDFIPLLRGSGTGSFLVLDFSSASGVINDHIGGLPGDSALLIPNNGGGSPAVTLGQWHQLEIYVKRSSSRTSRDGIVRFWKNGALLCNHTNFNTDTQNFNKFELNPTWGGVDPSGATGLGKFWYDHVRISVPNGTGPILTPPTISSFTPTSGTFGTPITIIGTNFDPVPGGNSVTLNFQQCTVLAAQPTQINTAVPNNATTGRLRVATSQGNTTSSNDFTVQPPEPTGDGLIVGSRVSSANTILSNEGTLDWAHWGLTVATSFNHKSGANLISDAVVVNATNGRNRYSTSPTTYTWASGTPIASATATPTGIFSDGTVSFTVPADTTERVLRVYGGCFNTPSMRVRATLSDNSAAAYTDTGLSSTLTESTTNAVWSIRYKAGSSSKLLTVDLSLTAGDGSLGNVALQAATLQLANAPTESITLSPVTVSVEEDKSTALTLSINPARTSDVVVVLSSSDPTVVMVPDTVTIPANSTTLPIVIAGLATGTTTITATLGSNTASAAVTVTEAPVDPQDPTGPATPSLNLYTSFLDVYRWM